MHEPDIEATARRDVLSLRVRRPARLDRDLGDVELDIHGAEKCLPRIRPGRNINTMWDCERTSDLLDRLGIPTSVRWRTTAQCDGSATSPGCIREDYHSKCYMAGCRTRDRGAARPSTKATGSTGYYGTAHSSGPFL